MKGSETQPGLHHGHDVMAHDAEPIQSEPPESQGAHDGHGARAMPMAATHDAAAQVSHASTQAHEGHGAARVDHTGHEQMFRQRFWVSLILSIPVLLYSPMIQHWLGFSMPSFPGSTWLVPVLSIIIFAYGGLPFLQMAVHELRNRQPGMMTLISLAITVAFVYSLAAQFLLKGETFFWELVTLIDIMLLGHWLEMRARGGANDAIRTLLDLAPAKAIVLRDGEEVPVSQLRSDDLLLVRPGASVPADGEVERGESDVDEAMITGESRPVKKAPGAVIAGTINGAGSLRVRVTATGEQTALAASCAWSVRHRPASRTQMLADRAAAWLFYVALGVTLLTAIGWTFATGFNVGVIARAATVLVIACPHALGLAIPLVVAITTAKGAANGILVRDRLALERARLVDTIIFDKTGTLTEGKFGVVGVAVADGTSVAPGWTEERALALAAAVEGDSEHTIARGIRRAAEERSLTLPQVTDFEALKGRGVGARADGGEVYIGGPRLLESLELVVPPEIASFEAAASTRGRTTVYLVAEVPDAGLQVTAALALADVIRPESRMRAAAARDGRARRNADG